EHAFERVNILTKIASVACIHWVALTALDRGRDVFAGDGRLDNVVYVADLQPVARGHFAINYKIQEIPAHCALGKSAAGVWKVCELLLDLPGKFLDLLKIGAENFHAEHATESRGKHFRSRLDRHPKNISHSGCFHLGVRLCEQLFPRDSAPPLIIRLQ